MLSMAHAGFCADKGGDAELHVVQGVRLYAKVHAHVAGCFLIGVQPRQPFDLHQGRCVDETINSARCSQID